MTKTRLFVFYIESHLTKKDEKLSYATKHSPDKNDTSYYNFQHFH